MTALLIIFLLFCLIIKIILWVSMLEIMEKKGLIVSYSWVLPGQCLHFYKLLKKEKDSSDKSRYKLILLAQILLDPFLFLSMMLLLVNIKS